jgi:hypothetical protein
MSNATDSTVRATANRIKAPQLEAALLDLLRETLKRGFFGTARLEWALQDGAIQHIKRSVEKLER